MLKIGLDVHGCIDKFPELFAELTETWIDDSNEVHVVTGQSRNIVEPQLHKLDIKFTHFYSIVDYHKTIGTKIWEDDPRGKGIWMGPSDWMPSKGNYAKEVGLNIHFDDSLEYAKFFPDTCSFVLVRDGFDVVVSSM